MTREEILDRYRRLRAINMHHHSAALNFLSGPTILEHAKRLGLAAGRTLLAESEGELNLVFDLGLYTAKDGRSRPLDRYARAAGFAPGSDEARMLEAMRDARFSIWRIERRHETAGLIVADLLREAEAWLIDEALEASAPQRAAFAARLAKPEDFAMTSGIVVPVGRDLIEGALRDPLACRRGDPEGIAEDPRFALAVYRAAVDSGVVAATVDEERPEGEETAPGTLGTGAL